MAKQDNDQPTGVRGPGGPPPIPVLLRQRPAEPARAGSDLSGRLVVFREGETVRGLVMRLAVRLAARVPRAG